MISPDAFWMALATPFGLLWLVWTLVVAARERVEWAQRIKSRRWPAWCVKFFWDPLWLWIAVLTFPVGFLVFTLRHVSKLKPALLSAAVFFVVGLESTFTALPAQERLGETLAAAGVVAILAGIAWFVGIGWTAVRWWTLTFVFVFPALWFAIRRWRLTLPPIGIVCGGVALWIAGTLVFGDLMYDHHPVELDRTLSDRFLGCTGISFRTAHRKRVGEWDEREMLRTVAVDRLSSTFDGTTAHAAAIAAYLSYKPEQEFNETAASLGFSPDQRAFIEAGNQAAIALLSETTAIVAFRGTEPGDIRDFFTDADARLRDPSWAKGAWGLVHEGFLRGVDALASSPRWGALVDRVRGGRQNLMLTGHSLGGALAVLMSARLLADAGITAAAIYTFGQPAVGNAGFARRARESFPAYFRVEHGQDPVVPLPMDLSDLSMFFGPEYQHAGQEIYLDSGGRYHVGGLRFPASARDSRCASGMALHPIRGYLSYLALLVNP